MAFDREQLVAALQGLQKASATLGHMSEAFVLEEAHRLIESEPGRIAAALEDAKREDRTGLWIELNELTDKISEALQLALYNVAAPAMRHLEAIMAAIADPLGDHFGTCQICDEPIFVRGQADDDCMLAAFLLSVFRDIRLAVPRWFLSALFLCVALYAANVALGSPSLEELRGWVKL